MIGLVQGAIFLSGVAFMDPTKVVQVFVKYSTTLDLLVGIANSVHRTGWHLPQLFVAGYMEHQPRRLPVYLKANTVQMCLIWGTIPIIAIYTVDAPVRVLGIFLVMYGNTHLAGGRVCRFPISLGS